MPALILSRVVPILHDAVATRTRFYAKLVPFLCSAVPRELIFIFFFSSPFLSEIASTDARVAQKQQSDDV